MAGRLQYLFNAYIWMMKLLRKFRPKKKVTIGDWSKATLLVDELKTRKLLRTTGTGAFYTFPELFVGPSPENMAKNLYMYARTAGLIQKRQTLYFRDLDPDKENQLFAQYDLENDLILIK